MNLCESVLDRYPELTPVLIGLSAVAVFVIALVVTTAILSRSSSPLCRDCARNVHRRHGVRGCPDPLCECRIRDSDGEVAR